MCFEAKVHINEFRYYFEFQNPNIGARCVARIGSRASFDHSRVGHRGGFSRLESGTTTPLPPPPQKWPGVRADFLHIKKKKKKNNPNIFSIELLNYKYIKKV